MEIIAESDIYSPSIDNNGYYVDKVPSLLHFNNGLRCPCGTRKDKTYSSNTFTVHIKTKTHQKWLQDINANRLNYYTENISLKDTIDNQKRIIARLEKDILVKNQTINILTRQLVTIEEPPVVNDLLNFD